MKPFSIIILFVIFSICGIALAPLIPLQLVPNTEKPTIGVYYNWTNASSLALEKEVTSILEGGFNAINEISSIQSISNKSTGNITLAFNKDVDMKVAQYEVSSVIKNLASSLPQDITYPVTYISGHSSDQTPIIVYSIITPPEFEDLRTFVNEKFIKALSKIDGVEKVEASNIPDVYIKVEYDYYKLALMRISPEQLRFAIEQSQERYPLGRITSNYESKGVLIQSKWKGKSDWASLPLKLIKDKVIRLGEVAKITVEPVPPAFYYRINGENSTNLLIYPKLGENQLNLAKRVKNEVEKIALPPGVNLLVNVEPTQKIEEELINIAWRAGVTFLILLTLIFLLYRSLKYVAIITIGLVANLAIAFLLYYVFKVEMHLFSLAGITVSFVLLIDTNVAMIDHIRHRHNKKVFLAILASTLTTIAALSVVFLLNERLKMDLLDFVKIVIINLFISLFISLFLVPALMENMNFMHTSQLNKKRLTKSFLSKTYEKIISHITRFRTIAVILVVLMFGIPTFMLPTGLSKSNIFSVMYNNTIGSGYYNIHLKEPVDLLLGGSLRLFSQEINSKNYFSKPKDTKLIINGLVPEGSSPQVVNEVIIKLEDYLKEFKEIEKFESFSSAAGGKVIISFKKESALFANYLKNHLTSEVIKLGSAEWEVLGIGDGFSNVMFDKVGAFNVTFEGYNYDKVLKFANNFKINLEENPRIEKVRISSLSSSRKASNWEYVLSTNNEKLALIKTPLLDLYQIVTVLSGKDGYSGSIDYNGENKNLKLVSNYGNNFNKWNLNHDMIFSNEAFTRVADIGFIRRQENDFPILKENQNYQINLEYDFIGPNSSGNDYLQEAIKNTAKGLPLGYTIKSSLPSGLSKQDKQEQNLSFLIIIALIFFICSILFESLIQPFCIIMIIPFNFIGVFLTYYMFDIPFNNGGYAALVLLSGLTVNAIIYIVNEINSILNTSCIDASGNPLNVPNSVNVYISAFYSKITPILVSILSTTLGLTPFLLGDNLDQFWYTLVSGTIGGMLFSLIGICFYLPIFFIRKKDVNITHI